MPVTKLIRFNPEARDELACKIRDFVKTYGDDEAVGAVLQALPGLDDSLLKAHIHDLEVELKRMHDYYE